VGTGEAIGDEACGVVPAEDGVSWGEALPLVELGGAGTLARRAVTSNASPTSATVTMRAGLNARLRVCTMALGYPPMTDPSTPVPRWIVHPTLLAAAFVLEVALANQVQPPGFIRSLVVALLAAAALTMLAWGLTRDRWLGGIIATGLILASLSFQPMAAVWQAGRSALGPNGAVIPLALALVLALAVPAWFLVRARRGAGPIRGPATSVLNRLSAILVIVVVVWHVVPDVPGAVADLTRAEPTVEVNPQNADPPDIYMILMDGYPRTDVLASRLQIDNSAFLDELPGLGFEVAATSRSNYVFTQMTLATMFQMRHIDEIPTLAPLIGTSGAHVSELRDAMTDGPVWGALRAAGFRIVASHPGYEHAALRSPADRFLDHGELTDLERDLLAHTWLLDLLALPLPDIFAGPQHDRILNSFDDLEQLAREAGEGRTQPVFTWMHIPAPHLPLVLRADGRTLPLEPRRFDPPTVEGYGMTDAQLHAAYGAELSYLNNRLLSVVSAIQESVAGGRPEPVIVIFSDHGYYYDPLDIQARFANFLAASTPGAPGLLAGSPTPINYFPLLLNRYLGTQLDLSEDRFFVSGGTRRLLEMVEIEDPDTSPVP